MNKIYWKNLIISVAITLGAGLLASLLSGGGADYSNMYKPPLSPPGWLFPIVWTLLYTLMGVSAYLIYESDAEQKKKTQALKIYTSQLVVNMIWPILFFRFDAYILAFAWLCLLWYLIFTMIRKFGEINALAGKLQIPYLLWVTFAGYLNLAIAINSIVSK